MNMMEWVICPICNNKTRIKIRKDTQLKNFPLYCPKCKKESLICVIRQIKRCRFHQIKTGLSEHLTMG